MQSLLPKFRLALGTRNRHVTHAKRGKPLRFFTSGAARSFLITDIIPELPSSDKDAKVGKVRKDGTTPRFFKHISVVKTPKGYEVEIDNRYSLLSTSRNERMVFPSEALAVVVASDWESMHDTVDLKRMPMYTLSSLAIDADEEYINKMKFVITAILETDNLICRPEARDADLAESQRLYQDPAIKWFQEEFGVPLQVIHEFEGDQAPETQELIRKIVESLDTWTLAGLYSLAESCTSIITALALMNRKMTVEEAVKATRAEVGAWEQKWGDVPGSTDLRRAETRVDIANALLFLNLVGAKTINKEYVQNLK